MNENHWSGNESLPLSVAQRVDAVCSLFEKAWIENGRPGIEDYLGDVPDGERLALLRELVPLDAVYRRQAGEQPGPEDYAARFPELDADWLAGALAARPEPKPAAPPNAREVTRTQRLRCPHCHSPIELADRRSEVVLCPGCGSSFHVQDAQQTSTTQPMRQVGKFQLLARVGLGAFGAVWKARDTELDRIVALKIPHTGLLTEGEQLERFRREARAAAQLRHPNIVTVHEVVELDGLPAIVSDFVEGVPLKELIEGKRLTFREAARLLAVMAEAVDYAHGMGLVHRDLKPANIMVEFGRPRLDAIGSPGEDPDAGPGRPLVMDFGLALRNEAEITMTQDGVILGTPAYMSPEQAAGYSHQADARSDVYSLGVIFYELLTGELPFRGSKAMLLHQVLREEPRPPRKVNDKVPRDLETICLKAMAKAPGRRYPSARELAEDLRRWLKGEPIQARPVGRLERAGRWVRRNPVVSGLLAAVVVVLVGGAGISLFFAFDAAEKASQAHQSEAAAITAKTEMERANRGLRQLRNELERTLTRSILRPLGLQAGALTDPEVAALWELAGNRGENVWRLFVAEAAGGPVATHQLRNRAAAALHAAVGLELTKRDQVEHELATRLRDPRVPYRQRLELALVTAALGDLAPTTAREVAGTVLMEITKPANIPQEYPGISRKELATALATVAGRLDSEEAAVMLAQAMAKAAGAPVSPSGFKDLAAILAAVAGRLEPAAAARAADTLVRAMARTPDPYALGSLAEGVAAVASRLEPATRAADTLAQAMARTPDPYALGPLAEGVAAVASRLESQEAAQRCGAAAVTLTQVIARTPHPNTFEPLAKGLAAVAGRLEPKEAAQRCGAAADILAEAMAKMTTDFSPLRYLAEGLAAVAGRLEPEEAARRCAAAAATLNRAMARTNQADTLQKILAGGLNALLAGSNAPNLLRGPAALAAAVGHLGGGVNPAGISPVLVLALQPPPCRLSAQELVNLLKQPTCIGEARRIILGHLGRRYGRRFRDHWEFVHFAQGQGLGLDFTSPPQRFTLKK